MAESSRCEFSAPLAHWLRSTWQASSQSCRPRLTNADTPLRVCLPGASCSPVDVAPALSQVGLKLRQGTDGSNTKGGMPANLRISKPHLARDALRGTLGRDLGVLRTRPRRPMIHPADNPGGSRAPSGGRFYIRGFSLSGTPGTSIRKGWDLAEVPEAKFQDTGGTSKVVTVMHGRRCCVRSLEIVYAEVWADHSFRRSWCDHSCNSFRVLGPPRQVDQQ